jgi:hypothetical protein
MLMSARAIAQGRALAQRQMTDTCRIVRYPAPAAGGVLDEATGQYPNQTPGVPADATVVYEGPCRIQIRSDINANIVEPQELEREWAYQTSTLQLPIDADDRIVSGASADVAPNDVCEYLTAPYEPSLPGRLFNVQATTHKSLSSVRRFRIREATR